MGIGNGWHRQIAQTALAAIKDRARPGGRYGLAGGNALQLHDITTRPTQDVDLMLCRLEDVPAAGAAIEEGLAEAGYKVELIGASFSWEAGEETSIREWEVTTPDGEHVVELQAAHFDLLDQVVVKDGIQVVGLADAAGWKGQALVPLTELTELPGYRKPDCAAPGPAAPVPVTPGSVSAYDCSVTIVTTQPRRRFPAAVMRRPVVVLGLSDLHGPSAGVITPPRHVWWSGQTTVDLDNLGQAVVFYDQLLDKGTREDIAAWAHGDKLVELWPTMGGRSAVRNGWEGANPQLAEAAGKAGNAVVAA